MSLIAFTTSKSDIPATIPAEKVTYIKDFQVGTDVWTWPTHEGLCLQDYERNGRDDSDFYMLVWNAEKNEIENICFATTRGWSYPSYGAYPDASEETLAAVYAHRVAVLSKFLKADAIEQAKVPVFGDRVSVIAGRKAKKGTAAEVFWLGGGTRGLFGFDNHDRRCGLRLPDGSRIFVNEKQVEVSGWEARVSSDSSFLKLAERKAGEEVARYRSLRRAG